MINLDRFGGINEPEDGVYFYDQRADGRSQRS